MRVVICGSFKRDPKSLKAAYEQLHALFEVVSPASFDFVDPDADFVRLKNELNISDAEIEQRHIAAITDADFIWLHAPAGYVGTSAMYELGVASALGIPVFSDTAPSEPAFSHLVTIVASPSEIVVPQNLLAPGKGLQSLQQYYKRIAQRRGWESESPQDTLLLMTEEMGELARAIRKSKGLSRDGKWGDKDIAEELADIQLYLVHLATSVDVNLAEAVTQKEAVNAERFSKR